MSELLAQITKSCGENQPFFMSSLKKQNATKYKSFSVRLLDDSPFHHPPIHPLVNQSICPSIHLWLEITFTSFDSSYSGRSSTLPLTLRLRSVSTIFPSTCLRWAREMEDPNGNPLQLRANRIRVETICRSSPDEKSNSYGPCEEKQARVSREEIIRDYSTLFET